MVDLLHGEQAMVKQAMGMNLEVKQLTIVVFNNFKHY